MSIYLDSNATTQVHPRVVEAMMPYLTDNWYNPSSGYRAGRGAKGAIEKAREQVASLIGASPEEIVFTGCGTESNNMALKSLARGMGRQNTKIVVSEIEHSAVLRPTEAMAAAGYEVEQVTTDGEGRLDLGAFEEAVSSKKPGFASIMWANNETGVVQPMLEVCQITKSAGWSVHTDAIQAVGKLPVRVDEVGVDFLSISGHKFHAPKGIGCLFIRKNSPFQPMIRGGGQEGGRRSGTQNVAYIVGLGEAAAIMGEEAANGGLDRVERLRNRLEDRLIARLGRETGFVQFNGSRDYRTGNVAHVSFSGCVAAEMLPMLDERGIQCSAGSACMTGKNQPSHVQKSMGLSDERAFSSLRLSLSIFSTEEEVDEAVDEIVEVVNICV
ncbi:MAG: cysteine desulfurase NifS [Verrucomicrobiales bacterium]|nr:cysteine desulfurase NifS [Verrucomicrobiales bacterium]|tara:strand:- start:26310 stop:27461 length:1152 start_codon:yes stop_codon:yes gene_type:complete